MTKYNKIYKGTVEDCQIKFKDEKDFIETLKSLEGKVVSIEVKEFKPYKNRSNNQNRYWHGVVCKILSDELGYTSEEIHEYLKMRFLSEKIPSEKITFLKVGSTAGLSTSEFESLCVKVRNFASSELGIYIPLPNEVTFGY